MLKNYKFVISYDGSRYYGWEHQPNIDLTIQGKIESVLSILSNSTVELIGAGRTDAGVHAKAMVANCFMDVDCSEIDILNYLNRYLPDDIIIKDVKVASDRFHSRYNAVGKCYRYTCYLGNIKPLFDRKYVYYINDNLNISDIVEASKLMIGEHDFMSFCSNSKMKKSTVRIVDSIKIEHKFPYLYMTFHGTGFLQHMVRIMSGTLLEVGMGKRRIDSIPSLFESRNRSLAGFTAPAQGLCLIKVDY